MKTRSGSKRKTTAKKARPAAKNAKKKTASRRATKKTSKKKAAKKASSVKRKSSAAKSSATRKSTAKKAPATRTSTAKKTKKAAGAAKSAPPKATGNVAEAKPATRKRQPSPRAKDVPAPAALIRADFSKPPTGKPLDRNLTGEKYRSALRKALRDSGLPRRLAHGALLPVLLSEGRHDQLRDQLDWALEDRVPAYYLAESFLQSYLFIGFPRTINALNILHEVNRSRRRSLGLAADQLNVPSEIPSLDRILGGPSDFGSSLKGRRIRLAEGPPMHLEAPGEGPGSFERYAREWWRRGNELCRSIYTDQFARLRENLGQVHPELADWMIFEGYGKVLSRPVIIPRERELWIIPLLMAQDVGEQLYSHLRGAINLEIPLSRIRAVIWLGGAVAGADIFHHASEMLDQVEKRKDKRAHFFFRT